MKRFARAFAVTFGVAVLGFIVSLVPQKKTAAQDGGPTVTIGSPLPLPVKGNVSATVSGTVAAQQSGNWNVGITGTPSVGVAKPVDRSGGVVPLPVDSEQAARESFFFNNQCLINVGQGGCDIGPFTIVSPPRVAVVKEINEACASQGSDPSLFANDLLVVDALNLAGSIFSGGEGFFFFPASPTPAPGAAVDKEVNLVLVPRSSTPVTLTLRFSLSGNLTVNPGNCTGSVSGYLVTP